MVYVRNDGNISKIWIGGMEHFQGPAIWKLSPIVSINDTTFESNFSYEGGAIHYALRGPLTSCFIDTAPPNANAKLSIKEQFSSKFPVFP